LSHLISGGALCATIATIAALVALRRSSDVERRLAVVMPTIRAGSRWRPVSDRDLDQSALPRTQTEIAAAKLLGLMAGAAIGAVVGNTVGSGAVVAIACAYAGFVLPSLTIERRAAARRVWHH